MLTELFNTTCTVSLTSAAYSKLADGSIAISDALGVTGVPCALQGKTSTEAMEYQRQYGAEGLTLYVPYTYAGSAVTIGHGDTVTVGSVSYKVRGPAQDMGGRGELLRVNVELIK